MSSDTEKLNGRQTLYKYVKKIYYVYVQPPDIHICTLQIYVIITII